MKNLIIISAPSGAGKTTLCKSIQAEVPQIKWSVSYTTRKIRKMEKTGIDYHFISESTFKKLADKSFFAELIKLYVKWQQQRQKNWWEIKEEFWLESLEQNQK